MSGSAEQTGSPDAFGPGDLGALVMVRFRQDDDATDVVGELESLTDSTLTIRRRDDSLVDVPTASVLASKLVGVSPLAARNLEGVAARGWPAPVTGWLGQWWLRAAGGFTARANAVRPLGPPGLPLDDALLHVSDWYADRGLPARVQVVVGSNLDAELEHRGWPADPEVAVQTAPVVQALARLAAVETAGLLLTDWPSPRWLALCRGGLPGDGNAIAVLTGAPDSMFAEVSVDGAAVAIGRAVVEGAWVGITAVEVAPDFRRQGLARAVMRSLLVKARAAGARQAYLEVLATNDPALRLYDSLGFGPHHSYRARLALDASGGGSC